jgi:hypothetical protein
LVENLGRQSGGPGSAQSSFFFEEKVPFYLPEIPLRSDFLFNTKTKHLIPSTLKTIQVTSPSWFEVALKAVPPISI